MSHHYYASTAIGFSVAATRDEALRKVARQAGKKIIEANMPRGGLAVVSMRVELPIEAPYEIESYVPVGVPTSERERAYIVDLKGKTTPRD